MRSCSLFATAVLWWWIFFHHLFYVVPFLWFWFSLGTYRVLFTLDRCSPKHYFLCMGNVHMVRLSNVAIVIILDLRSCFCESVGAAFLEHDATILLYSIVVGCSSATRVASNQFSFLNIPNWVLSYETPSRPMMTHVLDRWCSDWVWIEFRGQNCMFLISHRCRLAVLFAISSGHFHWEIKGIKFRGVPKFGLLRCVNGGPQNTPNLDPSTPPFLAKKGGVESAISQERPCRNLIIKGWNPYLGCRIGEAKNPGPDLVITVSNPTSLNQKHLAYQQLPGHVHCVAETAMTQGLIDESEPLYRAAGFKCHWGAPVPSHRLNKCGLPTRRGTSTWCCNPHKRSS